MFFYVLPFFYTIPAVWRKVFGEGKYVSWRRRRLEKENEENVWRRRIFFVEEKKNGGGKLGKCMEKENVTNSRRTGGRRRDIGGPR